MVKQKYYLALTTEEWRLMIECLNKTISIQRFLYLPHDVNGVLIDTHGFN